MQRARARGLASWACAAFFGLSSCYAQEDDGVVRGPYLQLATPTSVVVRWRTSAPYKGRVSFGPQPSEQIDTRSEAEPRSEHEIEIDGLQPASRYYYSIGTSRQAALGPGSDFTFMTPPLRDTPEAAKSSLRIWVTGDTGRCGDSAYRCRDARAVRDAYVDFAGASPAQHWILLGDLAYPSGSDAQFTVALFETFRDVLRNTFAWPVPGNHDLGDSKAGSQTGPYYEAFTLPTRGEAGGLPSGTEAYYSYDIGNVHFVALDSQQSIRSNREALMDWLRRDLAQSRADFKIAYWHHPPYSKGSHDSDVPLDSGGRMALMREKIVPILEAGGVDLQLSGHSHSYERSMLIAGHYGSSESFSSAHVVDPGDGDPDGDGAYRQRGPGEHAGLGTVYAVVGSSADNNGDLTRHPIMRRGFDYEGSLVLDIQGHQLDAHWIDRQGRIRDHFRISNTQVD